jgi:hypothetical protein
MARAGFEIENLGEEILQAPAFRQRATILWNRRRDESGGETFVAVMQAIDLR